MQSKKLTPRDVAQVALAYHAAAGNKEQAGKLAKEYLPDMQGLSDVLIGLVQADAKDFSGAATTLGRAYAAEKNPQVLKLLVGCVLAVAGQAVLKSDLKTAGESVAQALRLDPQNKAAKSLQDALSFASSLKSLNLQQLDEAITKCQQQLASDKSAEVIRSLAALYHRKAVQAELGGRGPDEAWKTCFQFWHANILSSQPFWPGFAQSYNAGRSRREKLEDDDLQELRTALPGQLVEVHTSYAKEYRQNRSADGLVRNLNLIWQWEPAFKPSDEFMFALINVRELDDWQAEMLEKAADRLTSSFLKERFRKQLAIYWYNAGGAVLLEIVEDMKSGNSFRPRRKAGGQRRFSRAAFNLDPTDSDIRELYNLAKSKF